LALDRHTARWFQAPAFFNPDGNRFSLNSVVEAMRNEDAQFIEFRLVVIDCNRAP
jgi:hypothetical protein